MTLQSTARRLALAATLPWLAAGLPGCTLLSPAPALELMKATATVASTAISYGPSNASNTVYHLHAPFQSLCIEYNRDAQVQDVLPALQAELRSLRIDSRIYDAGTAPETCAVWLRYAASMEWGIPPFQSEHRAYLSGAVLALQASDGRILSTSEYDQSSVYGVGKWASTRSKISPVVVALVTGFEN